MKIASVADVKAHFSAYLRASEQGPVIVTRNGKPAAVLLAVSDEDELERLMMAHSPRLREILAAARARIAGGAGIPEDEFWKDVGETKESKKRASKRASNRARPA
jgi:prevent-host-death family protein